VTTSVRQFQDFSSNDSTVHWAGKSTQWIDSLIDSCRAAVDKFITISSIPAAGMRRSAHFSHFPTNPDSLLFKLYRIIDSSSYSDKTHPFPQRNVSSTVPFRRTVSSDAFALIEAPH